MMTRILEEIRFQWNEFIYWYENKIDRPAYHHIEWLNVLTGAFLLLVIILSLYSIRYIYYSTPTVEHTKASDSEILCGMSIYTQKFDCVIGTKD